MSELQIPSDLQAMDSSPQSPQSLRRWVLLGVILIITVTFIRLVMNFRHALAPATDGAYYPMQTWWLLEQGRLMYNDLPLIFWLNAALARAIEWLTSMPLDESAMLASRLIDSTAQPLVAIFILMLGYIWSSGRREAMLGCGAAAVLAVFSPPIMRMASDFQKNSLGLVWMVAALCALRWAMSEPRRFMRWVLLTAVVLLAGLTHIGAFGVTCIMLVTAAAVYILTSGRGVITRRGVSWFFAMAGLGSVLLLVVWYFEPTRMVALLTSPWRLINVSQFRPSPLMLLVIAVYVLLGFYLRWLWRNRQSIQRCDLAVVMGALAAEAVLVFPLFPQDYVTRFLLMTPVPGAVLIAYVMARRASQGRSQRPAMVLAVVVLLLAIPSPLMMQGSTITASEADEIRSLSELIPDPTHTLVVAPHGVQYWAGALLHTPVRMGELPEDAFDRYARVLMLEQTSSSRREPPRQQHDARRPDRPEPPGLQKVVVPSGAVLLQETGHFKLYEINPPLTRLP